MWHDVEQEELKKMLRYEKDTGLFVWIKPSKFHSEKTGTIAGTISASKGKQYISIGINGKYYRAHRLAWLYVYGYMPMQIDHKNGNSLDNRIDNLLPATQMMNCQNHNRAKNGSGLKTGVKKIGGRFQARIRANNITYYLGSFETEDMASEAYIAKRKEIQYCPCIEGESHVG